MRVSSQEISKQAGEWAAKVYTGEFTPEEQERLEAWLAADVRHLGAFGRSIAVLERLDRFRAVGTDAMRAMFPRIRRCGRVAVCHDRQRPLRAFGRCSSDDGGVERPSAATLCRSHEDFQTRMGETRIVTLSDGPSSR